MLFRADELAGIRDGSITVAFRRWATPRVRLGTRLRTAVGLVEIRGVAPVEPAEVTDEDARRAGHESAEHVRAALADRPVRPRYGRPANHAGNRVTYRMELAFAGPDPRAALRGDGGGDLSGVRAALARMDRREPWTASVLRLIADNPGVRAPDLAARLGRETLPFKRDVRRLKELGLTESLPVGYRISPRGRAILDGA